jgi:Mor family transcriptional regulator
MKKISATKLSKSLDITLSELQDALIKQKLAYRKDKIWHLTSQGKEFGGETFFSKKYGDFIIWP